MSSQGACPRRGILPTLLFLLIAPGAARALPLFSDPVFPVGRFPVSMVSADLNGDGRPDLITVNNGSDDLSILLARQGGEFGPQTRIAVEPHPTAAAVGDFNGDGNPDLAACSSGNPFAPGGGVGTPPTLTLLLGRGDGSFQPPAVIPSTQECSDIVVADFNQDHQADLAMSSRGDSSWITILLGRGDGTFNPDSGQFGLLVQAVTMAVGDFNRDGNPDLALGHSFPEGFGGDITLFLGNGDGTFTGGGVFFTLNGVTDLVVADFNRDDKPDLAADIHGSILVFSGRGDGTFVPAPGAFPAGTGASIMTATDFNSDGRVDLAAVSGSPADSIFALPGRGDGTFDPALRSITGGGPLALVAGDFDGDGQIDMATADYFGSGVAVLAGHGDGTFGPRLRAATGGCPQSMAGGDFNRDGIPDLATANYCSDDASILLGRGDGNFEPEARYGAGPSPRAIVTPDFDNDAIPDLAVANGGDSRDVSVRLGLGDGSFGPENRIVMPTSLSALVSADFNRDGRADLAVNSQGPGGIQVLPGLGNGLFAPPCSRPSITG